MKTPNLGWIFPICCFGNQLSLQPNHENNGGIVQLFLQTMAMFQVLFF